MSNETATCPTCDGAGKKEWKVFEWSDKHQGARDPVVLDCIDCDGTGQVTDAQSRSITAYKEMWCKCGNPSGDVTFYDNGEHPELWKHHYRCNDCGKVVQIG